MEIDNTTAIVAQSKKLEFNLPENLMCDQGASILLAFTFCLRLGRLFWKIPTTSTIAT
jgi:hypothetical protein